MGNCLQQYRCAIGLFCNRCQATIKAKDVTAPKSILTCLGKCILYCLCSILLIISGDIEVNPGPQNDAANSLYMNCHSLKSVNRERNKLAMFKSLVYTNEFDFIILTETWLDASIHDAEILPQNYNIFRRDRHNHGGGVFLAVKQKFMTQNIDIPDSNSEILAVEVKQSNNRRMAFLVCYRPPDTSIEDFSLNFNNAVDLLSSKYKHLCIIGDFNFPNISWIDGSISSINIPQSHNLFCESITNYALYQKIEIKSNRAGNQLDLILTNRPDDYSQPMPYCNLEDNEYIFPTDHTILQFDIKINKMKNNKVSREVFNYKKANLQGIKDDINRADLTELVNSAESTDAAWNLWLSKLNFILNKNIPIINIKDSTAPSWIDHEVRHKQNRKHSAWKKARKTSTLAAWESYKRERNELKSLINNKYKQYLKSLHDDITDNPKRFWSFFRSKNRSKTLPAELKLDQSTATDAHDKAEMFNRFFHSVFAVDDNAVEPDIQDTINDDLSNVIFTPEKVKKVLNSLDISKAMGPDKVSPWVLKKCALELSESLSALFNRSMNRGEIPNQWLTANVIPIHKKGEKTSAKNYRPVSLLCIAGKVMERIIADSVMPILRDKIYPLQYGFMKGKSTTGQLLGYFDEIGGTLDEGGQTDIIYLDFAKAFDKVNHRLLLGKLKGFGINRNLLRWFNAYLSDRQQRVVVEGASSRWLPVLSGVPQGSILGPLLFNLYINDMPSDVSHSRLSLFADDAKCSRKITCHEDCELLQVDLTSLIRWSHRWKMQFNASKCQVLTVARKRIRQVFNYKIDDTELENVTSMRDLGVIIDSHLRFTEHIDHVINSANKKIGMIKRTMGYTSSKEALMTLYNTLVRSTLEYATSVWSPWSNKHITALERVQRHFSKYALGYPEIDYVQRMIELNLIPLSYRREILDLMLYFKAKLGLGSIQLLDHTRDAPQRNTRSSARGPQLQERTCKTETYKHSYFNRLATLWNQLPPEIRAAKSLYEFKAKVKSWYEDKMVLHFDVDNICTWHTCCSCETCRCTHLRA